MENSSSSKGTAGLDITGMAIITTGAVATATTKGGWLYTRR